MVLNSQKARDWLRMAQSELETSLANFLSQHHAASVHHAQQTAEKACKCPLTLLGIQFGKTHFPSIVMKREKISETVEDGLKPYVESIVRESGNLEREKETPRYGIEEEGWIIVPEEIYGKQEARETVLSASRALENLIKLIEERYSDEKLREIAAEVKAILGKVDSNVAIG